MIPPRLLKRTVILNDHSTGKPEQYRIVAIVPPPQPGGGATADDARREAEAVIEDARAIFGELVAGGVITTRLR